MATAVATTIREHIPLEQGLRLCRFDAISAAVNVIREHIPLEQGLRQTCLRI